MEVLVEKNGTIWTIIINRADHKNAVDGHTADLLSQAFRDFDHDKTASVAVLCGAGGCFCAGADLKAVANLSEGRANRLNTDMTQDGPMGPSRMHLSKPVIAAVSGYAVAGGLELACWCDLRIAEENAVFGVYCRRYGVPLVDGGTQRLPRLIGLSRAMDMILTARSVHAHEALAMGLVNYVVPLGKARHEAETLAQRIASFPQQCMRNDRQATLEGFNMTFDQAMALEFSLGMKSIKAGEAAKGAKRFAEGFDRKLPPSGITDEQSL